MTERMSRVYDQFDLASYVTASQQEITLVHKPPNGFDDDDEPILIIEIAEPSISDGDEEEADTSDLWLNASDALCLASILSTWAKMVEHMPGETRWLDGQRKIGAEKREEEG